MLHGWGCSEMMSTKSGIKMEGFIEKPAENPSVRPILFIGDARDYHAIDWYRVVKDICGTRKVLFATDLIQSEGRPKLLNHDDRVLKLYNIDWLLFRGQSSVGNFWRNAVKALLAPLQARCVRGIAKSEPNAILHAHTMYYMFLCWASGMTYIGTPQGSEILVRPFKSRIYRFFAIKALLAAEHVLVDSVNMQKRIEELCGKKSHVIQFGIDVTAISRIVQVAEARRRIVSIRGLYPNYRIEEIFAARNHCRQKPRLALFYPFSEAGYRTRVSRQLEEGDLDVGRIPTKAEMYKFLAGSLLAISIPESDSSPRSVYEAIFCGCCVAVTYNMWIETLPACMKARLFMVDLGDRLWLEKAIDHAQAVTREPYQPSEMALESFDQERSLKRMVDSFY